MSSRALVLSAVVLIATAVGCAGPAAMGSSPAPVQVTGTQLESALLPPTEFSRYTLVIKKFSSGSNLKDEPPVDHIVGMSCKNLLLLLPGPGFGPTAYAGDDVAVTQPPVPTYAQFVLQFARTSAATALYSQASAGYARCRSVTVQISSSPLVSETVHSVSKVLAGGHQAFAASMSETVSEIAGRPGLRLNEMVDLVVATDGADLLTVSRTCSGSPPATPALSDVIEKLIARVRALP